MTSAYARTVALPSLPDVPASLAAELAGRYVLEACIGEGGMGVVYRARHAVLGKPVAVKVLRAELGRDARLLERLRREAQSASRIESPHVVGMIDFGALADGTGYVVMELLEGHDLASELRKSGPFEIERAVNVARQLCDALAAAHDLGIVHRDLKPENVFLVPRYGQADFVKIVDFGLAKVKGAMPITVVGSALGTPQFMSPEQCAGDAADARSDVYALGLVLYDLLTGRLPFEQTTLHELLYAHIAEPPPPPSRYRRDIPPALEAVIMRCLAKRREDRFESMHAVRAAIGEAMLAQQTTLLAPSPFAAPRRGEAAPPAASAPSPSRRSFLPVLLAAVLFVLCASFGAGVFALLRWELTTRAQGGPPASSEVVAHRSAPAALLALAD